MAASSLDEGTAKEVLRQVEFYFSDSNIPRDNFLRNTIDSSEDGMVSLGLICSFNKMRGYLKLGDVKPDDVPEKTVKAVAETLRKSCSLKISEDGLKVGRIAPLLTPEEAVEQLDVRTVAASPLDYNVDRGDVESFFGEYGKVSSVRMPRHVADKRVFCGTALIEFSSAEDAEKILKQSLVFGGLQLELKPKKQFDVERAEKAEKFERARSLNHKNNANAEENYPKGLIVAFTLKSKLDGSSEEQNCAGEPVGDAGASKADEGCSENIPKEDEQKVPENASEVDGSEIEGGEKSPEETIEKDEKKEEKPDSLTEKSGGEEKSSEGPIVKDGEKVGKSNLAAYKNDKNVVLREDLKAIFENFGTVKFIDFKFGDNSGYIRFEQPEAAQKARAAAVLAEEGGLSVKNFIATLEPVSGEAEKEYWSLLRGSQERHRDNKGNKGRGGKFYRGGGKHSRSRDHDSASGRPNKAQRVAA